MIIGAFNALVTTISIKTIKFRNRTKTVKFKNFFIYKL